MREYRLCNLILLAIIFLIVGGTVTVAEADHQVNCLICHKHRGLSRIDEQGNFRLYYINNEMFESGPHRRNMCQDCHSDKDRFPHDPTVKVDCAQQCHIVEPSGQSRFSHKPIARTLEKSVHGKFDADGNPKEYQEDYPGCKDCHDQPLYRPVSVYKGVTKDGVSKRSLSRCKSCHRKGYFAEDFYEHVTSRLRRGRLPMEAINVCAKCHQDPEFLKRHELDDAVTTYKETFHGKLIALGSERTADCLDCHVVEGENTHLIESKSVPTSATNKANVGNTCRNSDCHVNASAELSSFQVHVTYDRDKYPMQFYMLIFFKALMAIILYFFLTMIFLELLRRLFPKFCFIKRKIPDDDAEDGQVSEDTGQ